ncbi:hypothetical protein [Pseudobdellovibrio exovorus]|uniref:Acyl-homoserine-lactone synthase n=1 Tax=Pseudobdellovibrio exovorus JSS TaxID=1184267 RepID=M4VDB4_9BACT|nr:hypothetical protein [Pseudobdellovibrio exovorus]AGH96006.1 hypothetical protein A11Q_1790 [Pseudobdellovibrio exovorus JSS]
MSDTLSLFQLYILPCSPFEQASTALYNSAYQLWHSVWSKTLTDLDGLTHLYSDQFTRNDFMVAIAHNQEVIALCCFKKMDLQLNASLNDSWFKPWPPSFLQQLSVSFKKALVPSWLSIHPKCRRSTGFTTLNFGLILSELIAIMTLHTQSELAFGTPRKDRSVHLLIQKAGGTTVFEDVLHHGVLIDLVCFFSSNLQNHYFSDETQKLWMQRLSLITNNNNSKENYENHI